jgi:hypothetical protein
MKSALILAETLGEHCEEEVADFAGTLALMLLPPRASPRPNPSSSSVEDTSSDESDWAGPGIHEGGQRQQAHQLAHPQLRGRHVRQPLGMGHVAMDFWLLRFEDDELERHFCCWHRANTFKVERVLGGLQKYSVFHPVHSVHSQARAQTSPVPCPPAAG